MIRKSERKDYEEIYRLGLLLHENFKETNNLDKLEESDFFQIYVFIEEDKVCGFLSFTTIGDEIEIDDLVVDENYRRKKIATNLLNCLITNSKPNQKIYLEVSINNKNAIELYNKFNFNVVNIRKKYYKNVDAYVMERVNENEE